MSECQTADWKNTLSFRAKASVNRVRRVGWDTQQFASARGQEPEYDQRERNPEEVAADGKGGAFLGLLSSVRRFMFPCMIVTRVILRFANVAAIA